MKRNATTPSPPLNILGTTQIQYIGTLNTLAPMLASTAALKSSERESPPSRTPKDSTLERNIHVPLQKNIVVKSSRATEVQQSGMGNCTVTLFHAHDRAVSHDSQLSTMLWHMPTNQTTQW
jgi:hypothetical protein